MLLVHEFLEHSAQRLPLKVALVCGGQRFTYAALDAASNRVANALRAKGVQRGDRVVLWGPNLAEMVIAIFAVLKAGAVFVFVNDASKPHQLAQVVDNCGGKVLVTTAAKARHAAAELATLGTLELVVVVGGEEPPPASPRFLEWSQCLEHAEAGPLASGCIDRDLACLIYTSGSTGEAKGVMCAHHQVVFASASILAYLHGTEHDVVLCALPLAFDYGLYQLLMTFRSGGTLVLERSFAYPADCLQRMAEERVTGFPGVPTMFARLLPLDLSSYDLSALRYLTNTAAALPTSHIERLQQKFPGVAIYSMYGLTETKRTLYLPPEELGQRPGSVGIAIPGTEVWIENDRGERLPPHEVGELVVRGGHVMNGYWHAPEATAARFREGPLPGERVCYSGDLFRRDEHGFHYFVGRKDDILKCRGEKVAPKEVENVLHELEGVQEAVVVGVPDEVFGQAVVAVIVRTAPTLTEREVLRHCRARLEDFKVPQRVEFHDDLPKTSTGKVRRADIVLRGG